MIIEKFLGFFTYYKITSEKEVNFFKYINNKGIVKFDNDEENLVNYNQKFVFKEIEEIDLIFNNDIRKSYKKLLENLFKHWKKYNFSEDERVEIAKLLKEFKKI